MFCATLYIQSILSCVHMYMENLNDYIHRQHHQLHKEYLQAALQPKNSQISNPSVDRTIGVQYFGVQIPAQWNLEEHGRGLECARQLVNTGILILKLGKRIRLGYSPLVMRLCDNDSCLARKCRL